MYCGHRLSVTRAIAGLAALSVGALGLGGCVRMTRHSNTLVFGTNTSLGIVVGTDATSTPSFSVGFKRQEAVVMPLVANVSANGELLSPCPVGLPSGATPALSATGSVDSHPCLLLGHDGNGKIDAYSVLASFGTKYDASRTGVGGSIAQYFATGVAAQHLALSGGAAVATGQAAAVSANKANVALKTAVTKAVDDGTVQQRAIALQASLDALAGSIGRLSPAELDGKLTAVDQSLGTTLKALCANQAPAACAVGVKVGGGGLLSADANKIMIAAGI